MDVPAPLSTNLLALAISNFASSLYFNLNVSNSDENVLFSPLSVYSSLSMTMEGAQDMTKKQILKGIQFENMNIKISNFHKVISQMQHTLQPTGSENMNKTTAYLVNALFADRRLSILKKFEEFIQSQYHAKLEKVDFFNQPQRERVQINNWVSRVTKNRINDLIPKDLISKETKLILINAVYFKSLWKTKFNPELTKANQTFYKLNGDPQEVSMMALPPTVFEMNRFSIDKVDFSTVKIPLNQKSFNMFISLPGNIDGLPHLEKYLKEPNNLHRLLNDRYFDRKIILEIPKFRIESKIDLVKSLSKMGMTNMFSNEADFSGITGTKDLKISDIIHQAFIEVNEQGAEAAASTGTVFVERGILPVLVNRPFLFIIGYKSSDRDDHIPIFIGRVLNI